MTNATGIETQIIAGDGSRVVLMRIACGVGSRSFFVLVVEMESAGLFGMIFLSKEPFQDRCVKGFDELEVV